MVTVRAVCAAAASVAAALVSAAPAAAVEGPRWVPAFVTAYTWADNTPAGGDISHGVWHREAGGTGTFEDPVTLAVGHDLSSGVDVLDWPAGTRFYDPALRVYLGVEDTCGDGPSPQAGACHVPGEGAAPGVETQVDVWIDGRSLSAGASARCAGAVTSSRWLIVNPQPGYPVQPGEIAAKCPDLEGGQQ